MQGQELRDNEQGSSTAVADTVVRESFHSIAVAAHQLMEVVAVRENETKSRFIEMRDECKKLLELASHDGEQTPTFGQIIGGTQQILEFVSYLKERSYMTQNEVHQILILYLSLRQEIQWLKMAHEEFQRCLRLAS